MHSSRWDQKLYLLLVSRGSLVQHHIRLPLAAALSRHSSQHGYSSLHSLIPPFLSYLTSSFAPTHSQQMSPVPFSHPGRQALTFVTHAQGSRILQCLLRTKDM